MVEAEKEERGIEERLAMSTWRERGERKGTRRGRSGRAREPGSKRERRGQAAPFIVSGHWGGAYLATAR